VGARSPDFEPTNIRFFECGDGWFDIIDVLCQRLDFWIKQNDAPQVVVEHVKSKFGRLVIQHSGGNDMTSGMIDMAQEMSGRVCEICRKPGKTQRLERKWIVTRCSEHAHTRLML
jgi:hypothetical protein